MCHFLFLLSGALFVSHIALTIYLEEEPLALALFMLDAENGKVTATFAFSCLSLDD